MPSVCCIWHPEKEFTPDNSGMKIKRKDLNLMKKFSAFLVALILVLACTASLAEPVGNAEYTVKTGVSYDETWGITVANVIYKGDTVFKILIDTVRPDGGLSSKEKYDDYGIRRVSGLGKEWWEEISFFETWAEGNDIATLELDESGHAVNADVISSATINLSNFKEALINAEAGVSETGEYAVKTGFSFSDQWGRHGCKGDLQGRRRFQGAAGYCPRGRRFEQQRKI
jgi:hypothetical protein